jgi:hypothetical protein
MWPHQQQINQGRLVAVCFLFSASAAAWLDERETGARKGGKQNKIKELANKFEGCF